MKKRLLLSIVPCALSLGACALFPSEDEVEIDPPYIELSEKMKINLQSAQTYKYLSPELFNSSTKNPTYTFKSSNEKVATVNSKGKVTALKAGTTKITATLKTNSDVKASTTVTVVDETKPHYDYTLMYYMTGSTLEYDPDEETETERRIGLITRDLQEILSVNGLSDSVRILVQTGGAEKWCMPAEKLEKATKISSTNLQRWEMNNDTQKLKLVDTLSTNKMASSVSLGDFLDWGLEDYEATQMGIIFSGHGGGIAGCGYDDNYLDDGGYANTLNSVEMSKGFRHALNNSAKNKFTWVGYDCCLMQCADLASVNADYFEYMVGSQEEENGTGWDHDHYIKLIKDNSNVAPTTLLSDICDSFVNENHPGYENTYGENCLQTLSVLDLSKMDEFITAFNAFSEALGTDEVAYQKAGTAFRSSYNKFGDKLYGLCDMNSFMNSFTGYTEQRQAVKDAVSELVIKNKYCSNYSTIPCGVNAFYPVSLSKKYPLQVGEADYTDSGSFEATKFKDWQDMCLMFGKFF